MTWFCCILALCGSSNIKLRPLAKGILLSFLFGVIADWYQPEYVKTTFKDDANYFEIAPCGTVVTFQENPLIRGTMLEHWDFTLKKKCD